MSAIDEITDRLSSLSVGHLTSHKAAVILARGAEITGFVIRDPEHGVVIVDQGAVRWLTEGDDWKLMHPDGT